MTTVKKNPRFGLVCAISAQVLWGCFPIYVYAVRPPLVNPNDFVAHRSIWSFFLLVSLVWMSRWIEHPLIPSSKEVAQSLRDRKILGLHAVAALLILFNWLAFVWAAMNDHVLDSSLGYYICPLVVVLLGVVLLRERLSGIRWLAVAFAAGGVGYTTLSQSSWLWISLTIAFSFGFYGLLKKRARLTSLAGLTLETGVLLIPALAYLLWRALTAEASMLTSPWWVYVLLIGSGLATIAPLAFYASAVKHLPLSTVGFLQFIGPTIQFVAGILFLGESLDISRLIGFGFVWVGVLLFLISLSRSTLTDSNRETTKNVTETILKSRQ